MAENTMYSLTTESVLDCTDEIMWGSHAAEMTEIENKLANLPDYDCAVIVQYQDPANSRPAEVEHCTLQDAFHVLEWGDLKNGADAFIDGDGFLVLVSYGQMYEMDHKGYFITRAYRILPYNKRRKFLNISAYLLHGEPLIISQQQF